jgi:hypothetical protein
MVVAMVALSQPILAQDEASVDPSGAIPTIDGPVRQCEIVASEDGQGPNAGTCIAATQQLLDALDGVEPAASDQTIADFVVAIVPLVQDDVCDEADDEVARAIRLAAAESSSPDQVGRLLEIADTVAACEGSETAEIVPDPDPASAA